MNAGPNGEEAASRSIAFWVGVEEPARAALCAARRCFFFFSSFF